MELKPCPFCGADKTVDVHSIFPDKSECFLCGATAPHWNSRPIEDALNRRIAELEEAQRWIPVSERLPEVDTRVEIFGGFEQTTHIGYYREHATQWDSEDGGYWHGKNFGLITHWRPLPEPPEGK